MKHDKRFRLTEEQIEEIKKRLAKGETIRSLSEVYGVDYTTIWKINKKPRWKPSQS